MRLLHGVLGMLIVSLIGSQASAQSIEPVQHFFRRPAPQCDNCIPPVSGPVTVFPLAPIDPKVNGKKDNGKIAPKTPDLTAPMGQTPAIDPQAFAQAPSAGSSAGSAFNPAMFGDLGVSGSALRFIPGASYYSFGSYYQGPGTHVRVPIIGHGAFKISDNESPRPTDRVFATYNYYSNINSGFANTDLHREVIGFEKTFLDGDASFGMRLPFLQTSGFNGASPFSNIDGIGDLSMIFKYAFINDYDTGNVLCGGMVVTVPTAEHQPILADGSELSSVLLQPYAGWIYNFGNCFLQGFHAIVIPTDNQDVTMVNNDIGVGYWLYKCNDGFIRGVVPTVEGHVFTPISNRSDSELIRAWDIFTVTAGVNIVLPYNSTLGAAVAYPLTNPRPNQIEGLISLNYRF